MRVVVLMMLVQFLACAHGQSGASDPLPVKRVVLYQNGIGYFERSGPMHGDTLRLAVRSEQINDLLTSLTVIDRAGGRSQSISLPIDKSAAQRLDELPPQVRQNGGLKSLLSAFRGARLSLTTSQDFGTLTGRVVGIEKQGEEVHLALANEGEIAHIPLSAIRRVKLLDRPLQVGLEKVLDHSLNQGKWKPVELAVRFDHAGKHDLLVSYVAEMPTWKPAYRLVLGNAKEGALLQGWAVVDNTSGEDWDQVELSLSSGSPISFRYDLHKPHFVQRPSVGVQHGQATAPVAAAAVGSPDKYLEKMRKRRAKQSGSIANFSEDAFSRSGGVRGRGGMIGSGSGGGKISSVARGKASMGDFANAGGAGAKGQAMRGLFRYDVPGRVTVPDRSSTLVSLVNRKIEGEDLLLYRPDAGGDARNHPYRAVRFKNDTGYMLQGGPVTVLSNGMFVGSGVFNRIEADAETFLPFSLERGISIKSTMSQKRESTKLLAIVGGRIRCEIRQRRTQKFEVTRLTKDAPARLYLRIVKRDGWSLKNPPKDTREHNNAWYVPATIDGDTSVIEVTDEQTTPRTFQWKNRLAREALELYLEGDAPAQIKQAIKTVRQASKELNELDRQRGQLVEKRNRINQEQKRLRRNISTLGEAKVNRSLIQKFSTRLGKNESAIAKINAQLVTLDDTIHSKREALKELVKSIKLSD